MAAMNETCLNDYDTYEVLSPPMAYLNKNGANKEHTGGGDDRGRGEGSRGSKCLCVVVLLLLLQFLLILLASVAFAVFIHVRDLRLENDLESLKRELARVNASVGQSDILEDLVEDYLNSAIENITAEMQQQVDEVSKEFRAQLDVNFDQVVENFTDLENRVSLVEILADEHQNITAVLFSMLHEEDTRLNVFSDLTSQNLTGVWRLLDSHDRYLDVLLRVTNTTASELTAAMDEISALDGRVINLRNNSTATYRHFTDLNVQVEDLARGYYVELRAFINGFVSNVTEENLNMEQVINLTRRDIDTLTATSQFLTRYAFESCDEVFSLFPDFHSGYYRLASPEGSPSIAYCSSDIITCGNITGGWRRIAFLNRTVNGSSCPPALLSRSFSSGMLTCVGMGMGCSSVNYDTHGIPYSKVCGMVTGYQVGSPQGFRPQYFPTPGGNGSGSSAVDSNYLDGVSITHGSSPRHHIWSLAVGHCANCSDHKPEFVGGHFTCDRAGNYCGEYCRETLWDGAGCGFDDGLWFHRELPRLTSDDIELRACSSSEYEDVAFAIETIELYVH